MYLHINLAIYSHYAYVMTVLLLREIFLISSSLEKNYIYQHNQSSVTFMLKKAFYIYYGFLELKLI